MGGYQRVTCSCGSTVWLLPTPRGGTMPVDVGRDPTGNLVAVRLGPRRGWGVRALTDRERAEGTQLPRYTAHWTTCPRAEQYRRTARKTAPDTWPTRPQPAAHLRHGPCARCRGPNPHCYGPGPSSPLCDTCRAEKGIPPVSRVDSIGLP